MKNLSYHSHLFDLKIRQSSKTTSIDMQINFALVNTSDVPDTLEFLKQNIPSVLKTQCFNDQNLPFNVEVQQTEIGHLFEHILIDNLCALRIKSGATSAVFNGTTSWNWKKNQYGSFQILIDIGKKDLEMLVEGLRKTINLTKTLISPRFNYLLTAESPTIRGQLTSHPQHS
ncbi:MAG: hypothetical protein SGJ02_12220 [bacterium]|nr:hypothetical protein [bacterium]